MWVTESSFLTVITAPGETVSEAGENMKFLMTMVSVVPVFWLLDDPVAVALDVAEALELLSTARGKHQDENQSR